MVCLINRKIEEEEGCSKLMYWGVLGNSLTFPAASVLSILFYLQMSRRKKTHSVQFSLTNDSSKELILFFLGYFAILSSTEIEKKKIETNIR